MKKEIITHKQALSMIAMFVMGSSLVLGISRKSKQDSWIAMLIAIAAVMPLIYIYTRLMNRFPGKNLFDISIEVFGKVLGKIVIILFVWFAFHQGAMILREFSEFTQVTTLNQMPQTISLLCIMFLIIWVARKGIETLGKWSEIMMFVIISIVLFTFILLIKSMHLSNLLPVGENLATIPQDAFNNFNLPFAQTTLFLGVLNTLKSESKPMKTWVCGVLIGGAILLFGMFFRNALVLGFPLLGDIYFPGYRAVSVIIAGNFISRIENVIGAAMAVTIFVKVSICLIVACKGFARLINADDYRPFVAPLGLMMVALASILYKSILEMFSFFDVFYYYAFPFNVIIPIIMCLTAEAKFIIKGKKEHGGPTPAN